MPRTGSSTLTSRTMHSEANRPPRVVFLPHANIQYSQLNPARREWVIRHCYEALFDVIESGPYKIAFEASGETISRIAALAPDVLEKLRHLLSEGKIEGVASPHTHIMLANVDQEIGLHSLVHGLDTWERHTGVRPTVGWNPECSWSSGLTEMFKQAGFESLVMDADSFYLSHAEIREATGLKFDVQGHSNKNQLFRIEEFIADKPQFLRHLTNTGLAPNGLRLIFRSDMMANLMLWYLMGATEGVREQPVSIGEIRAMLERWKTRIAATGTFIMPYAEDAEYIGTSAYFFVKQFGQARLFEPEPESVDRFRQMLDLALELGYALSTPSEVLKDSDSLAIDSQLERVENGVSWHGGTAKAWLNTPQARILDPVCREIFDGIKAVNSRTGRTIETMNEDMKRALRELTSAYVSDSRWPPAPTSPGRFNVRETLDDLQQANAALEAGMKREGVGELRSLYSPSLMRSRIASIEDELMRMSYFGEHENGRHSASSGSHEPKATRRG